MKSQAQLNLHIRAVTGLTLLVLLAATSAGVGQECQVPLFVKQSGARANIMVLADNSISMNTVARHQDFDPTVTWPGDFTSDKDYTVSSANFREPNDFSWRWPDSPSAYLVNGDMGWSGRYTGNYLNWIYYHATDEQRANLPTYTRIQVLRTVLASIVDYSRELSIGVTVFNGRSGGRMIAEIGTDPDDIIDMIFDIEADSYTPLAETLEYILDYFGETGADAPIQYGCEYNFCLVVTDGLPTYDVSVSDYLRNADGDNDDPGNCDSIGAPYSNSLDCSDYFDDVAYWAAHNDIHDLAGDQYLYTYVVGYDEDSPLLEDAARNGEGLYFTADNALELYRSIEFALQDVLRRISSGSAVAVVSTETGTDNRLYRGKFMPTDWNGYLECFELPYSDGDVPIWDSGVLLEGRSPGSRTIFTALGDQMYPFDNGAAASLREPMGVTTDAEAANLISWARGYDVWGYRDRQGRVLGDIVSATPVVVGPPRGFHPSESYQSFHAANQNRQRLVYVGANDGMLHAFNAESGEEAWAFVPEFALPLVPVMADSGYCHRFSCDQTVTVKDVVMEGYWRTIMSAGGGEGGASIFTLDVTYPDAPDVLWQMDLPNAAPRHSEVQISTIGDANIAMVGSGLEDDLTAQAYLYAYDLANGNLLGELELSTVNGRNKCSKPAVVDIDYDGVADYIYVTDMSGNVWRMQPGDSPDPTTWNTTRLFAGHAEITADPVVAIGPNGDVFVYFGTGAYLEDDDVLTTDQNYFVCVFDDHSGTTASLGDLANQSHSIHEVTAQSGWYVELPHEAERVTQRAAVVAREVIFTAFAPSGDACTAGGYSWLYQMRYDDGGVVDDEANEEDLDERMTSVGEGIASYPVVDLASGEVVVQSSDASIVVEDINAAYQRLVVRSWQETYGQVQNVTQGEVDGGEGD